MTGLLTLPPLTLYIHIPWCVQKCPYCDFNSHALKQEADEEHYVSALLEDLEQELDLVAGRQLDAIFIGGGTPSLFSASAIGRLLAGVAARIPFAPISRSPWRPIREPWRQAALPPIRPPE